MGYGALAILGGITSVQADPAPTLGGNLDAAGKDILHVRVLTSSALSLNDVALVANLSTFEKPGSEGVRLEGAMGKLTMDNSGALLEKIDYLGHSVATLSLQDSVRLQGPGEVDLVSGGRMLLSAVGGTSYFNLGSAVHLISAGELKITGLNSGLVEILSHYNGINPTTAVIGIQGNDDALVARLTFDTNGNATFDSTQGGLIPPRYTTSDLTTILTSYTPPAGYLVFNTTLGALQYHDGSALKTVTAV